MSGPSSVGPYDDLIARALRALVRADDALDPATLRLMALSLVDKSDEALDAALLAARAPRRSPRNPADLDARARIEAARRRLLMPMPAFLETLAARLDAEYDAGVSARPKSQRRSLARLLDLAANLGAPAETVADVAEAFAREKSLAYDIA